MIIRRSHPGWVTASMNMSSSTLPASRETLRATGPTAGLGVGITHCAVRWKTVSRSTWGASAAMIWAPVDPVPTTPTRRPASGTAWSQRAEWNDAPAKSASPSRSG